jgi:polar amino acid transport system substrate-binding protein
MSLVSRIAIGLVALAATTGMAGAQQTVRIGTEGAYPPFNFIDASGELQGFDIEIAKALCDKMGVECTFVAQDWDGIIPALLANRYDAIFASMSITDERKEVVDFSRGYYTNSPSVFVAEGSGIADVSADDIAGKTLGAQSPPSRRPILEDNYGDATHRLYPTQEDVYLDLAGAGSMRCWSTSCLARLAGNRRRRLLPRSSARTCSVGGEVGIGVRKEETELAT